MTLLTDSFRRLGTLAHERAEEYRKPYADKLAAEEMPAAFAQSGSYSIYSSLMELKFLLNKLADEIEGVTPDDNP